MKQDLPRPECCQADASADPLVCPLSRVEAGSVVCIRKLATSPEMTTRLRELGLCEDRKIRLLLRDGNLICMVCNARVGLSGKLAESILVEAASSKDNLPTEP